MSTFFSIVLVLIFEAAGAQSCRTVHVISDMNGGYCTKGFSSYVKRAIKHVVDNPADLVLSTGDHVGFQIKDTKKSYDRLCKRSNVERHRGQSWQDHLNTARREAWEVYMKDIYFPITKVSPFCMSPGNHDTSAGHNGDTKAYETALKNHRQCFTRDVQLVDIGNYPFYYAFSLDKTLFIAVDNRGLDGDIGSGQRDWMQKVLKENKDRFNKKIMYGHFPLYGLAKIRHRRGYLRDRRLNRIISQNCIDAYLSGHHHVMFFGLMNYKNLAFPSGYSHPEGSCKNRPQRDSIKIVSQGSLSGRGRVWHGSSERSPRGITSLKICKNEELKISATTWKKRNGQYQATKIKRSDLPSKVGVVRPDPDFE